MLDPTTIAPAYEGLTGTQAFDFRRPDRISRSQIRAIHNLHETFARNLTASLSAYLRAYLTVTLVSVEQLTFEDFRDCLPSSTCLLSMNLRPYDGRAIMEINLSLIYPIIEMVLGGDGKRRSNLNREITEIELGLVETLFRIILQDLQFAWRSVAPVEFAIDSVESKTQALRILAAEEAMVAIGLEVRIGEISGMMNLAIPSVVLKMMRQSLGLQQSMRRPSSGPGLEQRILRTIQPGSLRVTASLEGAAVSMRDLAELQEGDVLVIGQAVGTPVTLRVNGKAKFEGQLLAANGRRALLLS